MSTNDGGPAFPVLHSVDGNWVKEPLQEFRGMTLRDYFAAKAMQGMAADPNFGTTGPEVIAKFAYAWADYMLQERSK